MTSWLLNHDLAVQGLALATLIGVSWIVYRWRRPNEPQARDLVPMSNEWMTDRTLHRKDPHAH